VIKLAADKSLEMRVIGSPNGRNFWMIVSRDDVASMWPFSDLLRCRRFTRTLIHIHDAEPGA
jgi:hypothetical protein